MAWIKHKHLSGYKRSPTYTSWVSMKSRCLYPSSPNYKHYGERGITICIRWMKFENFLSDMGERPEGKNLGRKDNDGNYEPGNCRWETQIEQVQNRRKLPRINTWQNRIKNSLQGD